MDNDQHGIGTGKFEIGASIMFLAHVSESFNGSENMVSVLMDLIQCHD